MTTPNWLNALRRTWQQRSQMNPRRRTAQSLAVAAEVVEERILLSGTAIASLPDPNNYGLDPNDPSSFSANNPTYLQFVADVDAYVASTMTSANNSSFVNNYANWFNSNLGSGWSNLAGGTIYSGASLLVSDTTLANTSDTALIGTTIVVSVGVVVVGEYALGVGTIGALTAPVVETVVAAEVASSAGSGIIVTTIEVTLAENGTWIVGTSPEAAALAETAIFSLADTWPAITLIP